MTNPLPKVNPKQLCTFFSKILYFGEQGELGVSIEPMHAPAVSALWAYKGSLICQTVLG